MAVDEYRRNAIECLRIADETITARSRVLLIHMAEAWMRLAQQAEKNLTTDLVYEKCSLGCAVVHRIRRKWQGRIELRLLFLRAVHGQCLGQRRLLPAQRV